MKALPLLNRKKIIKDADEYNPDYKTYYYTKKEFALTFIKCLLRVWFIAYCFFGSFIMCLLSSFYCVFEMKETMDRMNDFRRGRFGVAFKDGIGFLAGAVNAGYSVENGWKAATTELIKLHGKDSDIAREFAWISKKLDMNIPLTNLLFELATRTGIDDINSFAESFSVAKKSGGNMRDIMTSTARTIGEKVEVTRDIETMIAGKKMEYRIMSIVPPGIICFVNLSSPGFLGVLYHNPLGMVIMTLCLCGYLFALKMSKKIMKIEV